jgi:hypothetical protein
VDVCFREFSFRRLDDDHISVKIGKIFSFLSPTSSQLDCRRDDSRHRLYRSIIRHPVQAKGPSRITIVFRHRNAMVMEISDDMTNKNILSAMFQKFSVSHLGLSFYPISRHFSNVYSYSLALLKGYKHFFDIYFFTFQLENIVLSFFSMRDAKV